MYVMGKYDNGDPDTGPTEMQTGPSLDTFGTVANSSPDDRGLGSDKTFHISIRCVRSYCMP